MVTAKKAAPRSAPAKKQPAPAVAPARKAEAVAEQDPARAAAKVSAKPAKKAADEPAEGPVVKGVSKDGIAYTKDFDIKFLTSQKALLLAEKQSLTGQAVRLEDEANSLIEDGEMGDVEFGDEGGEGDTMVVQRDLDRVLSTQARQTIEDIDAALERIKLGTYGYSEVSGLPIPRERLEALPETTVLAAEKVSGIGLR